MAIAKQDPQNDSEVRFEAPVADFIPYACHFDASTLLTKNGQLLQTIKIIGLSKKATNAEVSALRDGVRKSILGNITSDKFAIWIHTVRRKTNLDPGGNYNKLFTFLVHEAWCKKNYWRDKYVNELYITIVIDSESFHNNDLSNFVFQRKKHAKTLEDAYIELDEQVQKCLDDLKDYSAKKLTIGVDRKGAYSELLQFFDKIIYLREQRNSLPITDLSDHLASEKIAFGNNAFQVKDEGNKRSDFYGAMLTIKEYHELSKSAIDEILQFPQQLVVTESIQFIDKKIALESYKYQKYIFGISNEEDYGKLSGLDDLFAAEKNKPTDYCHHQITITIIDDDIKSLDNEVKRSAKSLSNLGIIAIREDLNLENCFWAQLPGNFTFIRRKSPIQSSLIAGFASLMNFTVGDVKSIWGDAVTIFRTRKGTPYFFNFHHKSQGHTLLVGSHHSGKSTLMNFLLCEASKFSPRILILDCHQKSRLTIKAMEGEYEILSPESDHKLNPLMLGDNEHNRIFLKKWLAIIIFEEEFNKATKEQDELIEVAIKKNFSLEKSQRKLENIIDVFKDHPDILEKLAIWHSAGKYNKLFNSNENKFFSENRVKSLDITDIISDEKNLLLPTLSFLIHEFNIQLDGSPSIIVINDAWHILNHPYIASYLKEWLDFLTNNNAILIFTAEITEKENKDTHLKDILEQKFVTKIYLPDNHPEIYKDLFELSSANLELIKSINNINRNFLLLQDQDVVVGELNLAGIDFMIGILSNDTNAWKMINEIIARTGSDDVADWLELYYEKSANQK